jgi:hypothetical protein
VVLVDPLCVGDPSFDVIVVGRIGLVGDGRGNRRVESDAEFQDNGEFVREVSAIDQVLEFVNVVIDGSAALVVLIPL